MSFTSLQIPRSINTSTNDVSRDFFIPLLSNATSYDRGVGYFTSGWLKINSIGLLDFANNGGKARWITSPILSKEDWEAIKKGDEAKENEVLHKALADQINSLRETLEVESRIALAWMIADGILEFKLAVTRNKLDGEFHDKFGIFTDREGNRISFSGSYNESIKGTRNYDSFKVFKSWIDNQSEWVIEDMVRFERLWNNEDPNVRTLNISDANKKGILQLCENTLRPYKSRNILKSAVEDDLDVYGLYDYQKKAIIAWFNNDGKGFFEMATGSGKTKTALAASKLLMKKEGRLALVIVVPYQHLVDQWNTECRSFSFRPISAYKNRKLWEEKLATQVVEYNNHFREEIVVITTNDTFTSPIFRELMARIDGNAMLLADEAHHLGSESAQASYPTNFKFRLALSATPNRWFDDQGTESLRSYFGSTVFEFTIGEAIGLSLTPYDYWPELVSLTSSEIELYRHTSAKIVRLASKTNRNAKEEFQLKLELKNRSNILNNAENKIEALSALLVKKPVKSHTLFYCSPESINKVVSLVGDTHRTLIHPFTYNEKAETRKKLLKSFSDGIIQALAAIRCLDEGVDVPNTHTAYLLASSSNPREFIQRRGRVLRKAPGKTHSVIHDLIAIPPITYTINDVGFQIERSVLRKELRRFREFANYARNKHQAIDIVWNIANQYQLLDF